AELSAMETRNFDASTFNAWFTAYTAGDEQKMAIAAKRFSPTFRVAFEAWLATRPATNPKAPPGPTYMPQYPQPEQALATAPDTRADAQSAEGAKAGSNADGYVRDTISLATVLFLVGISSHFRFPRIRYALAAFSCVLLLFAVVEIIAAPHPP